MRRALSFVRSYPAIAVAVIALLAALGGYALAASSSNPVIRACANKKTGALRVASRCRRKSANLRLRRLMSFVCLRCRASCACRL